MWCWTWSRSDHHELFWKWPSLRENYKFSFQVPWHKHKFENSKKKVSVIWFVQETDERRRRENTTKIRCTQMSIRVSRNVTCSETQWDFVPQWGLLASSVQSLSFSFSLLKCAEVAKSCFLVKLHNCQVTLSNKLWHNLKTSHCQAGFPGTMNLEKKQKALVMFKLTKLQCVISLHLITC